VRLPAIKEAHEPCNAPGPESCLPAKRHPLPPGEARAWPRAACGARAPLCHLSRIRCKAWIRSLPSALKLDALATDTACEGDITPSCVLPYGRLVRRTERPFGPLLVSPHAHASALSNLVEPTAVLVRRIFTLYTTPGYSLKRIAATLTREGRATARLAP